MSNEYRRRDLRSVRQQPPTLAFRQHGAGLFAGGAVEEVVADEDLRRSCARSTVLGHVVRTDVDGGVVGFLDKFDGNGLAVGTGHTIGLALGGLDHQEATAVVGEVLVQFEPISDYTKGGRPNSFKNSLCFSSAC